MSFAWPTNDLAGAGNGVAVLGSGRVSASAAVRSGTAAGTAASDIRVSVAQAFLPVVGQTFLFVHSLVAQTFLSVVAPAFLPVHAREGGLRGAQVDVQGGVHPPVFDQASRHRVVE